MGHYFLDTQYVWLYQQKSFDIFGKLVKLLTKKRISSVNWYNSKTKTWVLLRIPWQTTDGLTPAGNNWQFFREFTQRWLRTFCAGHCCRSSRTKTFLKEWTVKKRYNLFNVESEDDAWWKYRQLLQCIFSGVLIDL